MVLEVFEILYTTSFYCLLHALFATVYGVFEAIVVHPPSRRRVGELISSFPVILALRR